MANVTKPARLGKEGSALPNGMMNSVNAHFDVINDQLSKQIEGLKGKGVDVNGLTTLLSTAKNTLVQAQTTRVEAPQEMAVVNDNNMLHAKYYARLDASRTALSNPTELARLAHDAYVEHTYLRILNGEMPSGTLTNTSSLKDCPGMSISITKNMEPQRFRETNKRGEDVLNQAGQRIFATYLYTDAKRQQEVHLLTLQTDQLMKLLYLYQETELLDSMIEQQDALVRGLTDWSDYLDQQTQEYVEMYEKLDGLISTQRRQSSFTVRDIQSLEQWTYWSQVVFWILLASCGLMAVVHNYSAVSKTAEAIDAGIGRVRTTIGAA